MFQDYDYWLVTEKTKSNLYLKDEYKDRVHFLIYGTKHHFLIYPFKLLLNCFISLFYYIRFKPDYIITTGVHTAGPAKLRHRRTGSAADAPHQGVCHLAARRGTFGGTEAGADGLVSYPDRAVCAAEGN